MAVTSSVLYPIIIKLGIDPVHYGIIVILNLMIGNLTPPVGPVLFVVATVWRCSIFQSRHTFPFILPLLVVMLLITHIPQIVLFIPNMFVKH